MKNQNLKRIITACLFTIGLLALLVATSRITVPKTNEPGSGMEEVVANGVMGEGEGTVDVLFIGDSESHNTFIPLRIWEASGYTSYNCGTGDQTLDYSYEILRRTLEKQDLRIVFLEANAIYYKESKEIPYAWLCEKFPVFRYHNRWKKLVSDDFTKSPEYTWTDYNKGYHYTNEIVPSKDTDYVVPTEERARIRPRNRYYVRKIKQLCDRSGAQLVFISTPSTANFTYKRHNGTSDLAAELGCEFIDMNLMIDELGIDWNVDTKDKGNHLNYTGALKATAWMTDYLEKTGLLEDHRKDPGFKAWEEALRRFEGDLAG